MVEYWPIPPEASAMAVDGYAGESDLVNGEGEWFLGTTLSSAD